MHLILLRRKPRQEMHIPGPIHLFLQCTRRERPLLANQDIKVVIRSMQPRVPLRAQGRPEDNEVLRDRRVDDVHCAHRTARVVEHPFRRLAVREVRRREGGVARVEGDNGGGVGRSEVRQDVRDHTVGGVWGGGDGGLRELVQEGGVEDVPTGLS